MQFKFLNKYKYSINKILTFKNIRLIISIKYLKFINLLTLPQKLMDFGPKKRMKIHTLGSNGLNLTLITGKT